MRKVIFDSFDNDKDKKIDEAELTHATRHLLKVRPYLKKQFDKDKDGEVAGEEFSAAMKEFRKRFLED